MDLNFHCLRPLFVFLLMSATALANKIEVEPGTLSPGSQAEIGLNFSPSPEPITALQFDIDYHSSSLQLIPIFGQAARDAVKFIRIIDVSPSTKRFVILGLNQSPILSGRLITLLVSALPNATLGGHDLTVSNVAATFANGISAPASGGTGTLTIQLGPAIRFSTARIFSAATLLPGPLAPGEIISLLSPGIGPTTPTLPANAPSATELAGTSLWFDNTPAPLLYAGPNQINAVVPFDVAGKQTTQISVRQLGTSLGDVTAQVAQTAPGIFTLDFSGAGQAAVLNMDQTVNGPGNPARGGDVISIFSSGAGQMDPPGRDGETGIGTLQNPLLTVQALIDGADAEVLYAGPSPGLISGLLQINCRIPRSTTTGPAIRVEIVVGGVSSTVGATIAIH